MRPRRQRAPVSTSSQVPRPYTCRALGDAPGCPFWCGPASARAKRIVPRSPAPIGRYVRGLALDNALFLPQRRSHDRNFVTVVRSFGDGLPSALRVEVLGRAGVQVQAAVSEQRCASLAGDDES
jgi:hypothetical protein